jgi:plasmid maintenance system antidote protein VapI
MPLLPSLVSFDRKTILVRWMEENERGPAWVARKIGCTRSYISSIVNGHRPVTDKLAAALEEEIGIDFSSEITGPW